jgi:hypothetical protein
MRYDSRGRAVALLVAVLAAMQPAAVHAATFEECVRRASGLDLEAKTVYQRGTHDLIVRNKPEFAALAAINRDLRITRAWARAARYVWLLRHDATRIRPGRGLSAFRNFDWNPEDETAFRESNAVYDTQSRRIESLAKANDGNAGWPALREYFTGTLFQNQEFRTLTKHLNESDRLVAEIIAVCPAP